jgi:hypothetical protein
MSVVTVTGLVGVDWGSGDTRELDVSSIEIKSPDCEFTNILFQIYVNSVCKGGWYLFDGERMYRYSDLREVEFSHAFIDYVKNHISEWSCGLWSVER